MKDARLLNYLKSIFSIRLFAFLIMTLVDGEYSYILRHGLLFWDTLYLSRIPFFRHPCKIFPAKSIIFQARIQDFEGGGALGILSCAKRTKNFQRPTTNCQIGGAPEVQVGRYLIIAIFKPIKITQPSANK